MLIDTGQGLTSIQEVANTVTIIFLERGGEGRKEKIGFCPPPNSMTCLLLVSCS